MIVWLPTVRLDVLKLAVAMPPVVLSVPWPMLLRPSENVTTPVGLPGLLMVAVNVTLCPNTDELAEDTTTRLVFAWLTVSMKTADVLGLKLGSPPYLAVTVCEPAANDVMVKSAVARPPEALTSTGLPTLLPSIWNWTVPVGVPDDAF